MMIAQLFEKFLQELEKLLKWFLRFAKRVPNFQRTKPYEYYHLGDYDTELGERPLLVLSLSVNRVLDSYRGGEPAAGSDHGTHLRVPFRKRLKNLRPKQVKHAIEARPQLEAVYFRFCKWINLFCSQFHRVHRIERSLYKRMRFKGGNYLRVSPASSEKDAELLYDEKGMPIRTDPSSIQSQPSPRQKASSKHDAIFLTRERIEFVIKDQIE